MLHDHGYSVTANAAHACRIVNLPVSRRSQKRGKRAKRQKHFHVMYLQQNACPVVAPHTLTGPVGQTVPL